MIASSTTGNQTFASVIASTPMAALAMDATEAIFIGGTDVVDQPNLWTILKWVPPLTVTSTPAWSTRGIDPPAGQTTNADHLVALILDPTSGHLVAVGQTTPLGAQDVNDVQTSVAVHDPSTGATTKTIQVNVFSLADAPAGAEKAQEHPGSALLSGSSVIVGGQLKIFFSTNSTTQTFFAKINVQ